VTPGLSCARVRGRLERYLDAGLSPLEEAQDRGHLEVCAGCRAELESWRSLVQDLRVLATPPADEVEALVARIERTPRFPDTPWRTWRVPRRLAGLAAALLALLALQASGAWLVGHPALASAVERPALDLLEGARGRLPTWSEVLRGLEHLTREITRA